VELTKSKIIIDYTDFFKERIKAFYDYTNNGKITNKFEYVNANSFQYLDIEFKDFIGKLNKWWKYSTKIFVTNMM